MPKKKKEVKEVEKKVEKEVKKEAPKEVKEDVIRITFKGGFKEFSEKVDGADYKKLADEFFKSFK